MFAGFVVKWTAQSAPGDAMATDLLMYGSRLRLDGVIVDSIRLRQRRQRNLRRLYVGERQNYRFSHALPGDVNGDWVVDAMDVDLLDAISVPIGRKRMSTEMERATVTYHGNGAVGDTSILTFDGDMDNNCAVDSQDTELLYVFRLKLWSGGHKRRRHGRHV